MASLLRRFGSVLLAGILAHGAWVFVAHAGATLRSPWSGDYGEGCTLAMAQLLAERGNYFPDLADYPFFVANYPPVFLSLVALTQKVLGPSLFVPRFIALVATLGLLAVLFDTLRWMLGARAPALAFTVLFVMPWFVTTWAALARVDTTAILLSLAGLSIVLRRGTGAGAWPALPVFWLAFFTKQNALVAPAAVLLDLGLARTGASGACWRRTRCRSSPSSACWCSRRTAVHGGTSWSTPPPRHTSGAGWGRATCSSPSSGGRSCSWCGQVRPWSPPRSARERAASFFSISA